MRNRLIAVAATLLATLALMAAPSLAHHDDDESQYQMPAVSSEQREGFEAAAAKAAEGSNAPSSFAPCRDGMAGGMFPCDGVDLMSWLDHSQLGTTFVNDIWGWTDARTGADYALVGATEGTVFVDISDPKRPDVVGILPAHTLDPRRPFWRDIKVYSDHAFVVSEQSGHGMQVFDLTQLADAADGYETFTETAHYDDFGRAHNININTDTGYAYAVGATEDTRDCGGGLHMIDVSDPANPGFAGCFGGHGYIHDTQCVVYNGSDADHRGREICFNSNAAREDGERVNTVSVVDVTDKQNPVALSRTRYANDGYSHQGWLTPDQRYFLHGDELDELRRGIGTTTRVWDMADLDSPQLLGAFENDTTSIDHNLYTQGRYAYASNYTSGLRVYDSSNVATGELSEVAWFDVYPENDNTSFEGGTWSNYPYFRQKGIVAVSSMDRGLFVLRPRVDRAGN